VNFDETSWLSAPPSPAGRLGPLASLLQQLGDRWRYVDYAQAERDCERLAAALLERFSTGELARFAVAPIPRGGLIVAAMLAYLLELPAERFGAADAPGPLLVFDDCALTGLRFRQTIGRRPRREVVFAHLYSHPELRRAILAQEPRVLACLAAQDLGDVAAEAGRTGRWRALQPAGERYWLGLVEPVSFAWSEPDVQFWNPDLGRVESGWLLAPPHRCLKTRGRLGPPPARSPRPRWRVAEGVVCGDFDGVQWLCARPGGELFALEGSGRLLWRRLARHGDPELAAEEVAAELGADVSAVATDLVELASDLAGRGLLEPAPEPGDGEDGG
jgi:hypothetical protein